MVKHFRICDTSGAHCIADKIELYVRHMMDNIESRMKYSEVESTRARGEFITESLDSKDKQFAIDFAKSLRGDNVINGNDPRSVAGAIVCATFRHLGCGFTMEDIHFRFDINPGSIRRMLNIMAKEGTRFPDGNLVSRVIIESHYGKLRKELAEVYGVSK
jgi:hypothetical protein